jgi:hypothetical protein
MFIGTEADLDGDTVVVEFRPEGRVFKSMAEDADVTALVRESIKSVLGWHVGVRYQLGRGGVRALAEDEGAFDDDAGSVDDASPAPAAAVPDGDSLDRMFTEALGAEIVSESGSSDGKAVS